jgi:uncharacterized protein YkwD
MAPVTARIRLRCNSPAGQPMTHLLGFGAERWEIVQDSPISLSRTFERTTEVRGLCRDGRGGSYPVAPRIVPAINAAEQRDSVRVLSHAARRRAGVNALEPDAGLDSVASRHARDMAERNYFGHETPEGRDFVRRLKDGGIVYATAAENIAGNATAAGAVQSWLESPGHRQNLLDPVFSRIGVGVYRTLAGPYTCCVQIFAR